MMFFTETWLSEDHSIDEYSFQNFKRPVYFHRPHGGVIVYIKEELLFKEVESPIEMSDSIWIEMETVNSVKRLYGVIYRSPNTPETNNEALIKELEWACKNYKEGIIIGDFNLPKIDWKEYTASGSYSKVFLDCLTENELHQLIQNETRYRHNEVPSLLDLLLTKDPETIEDIQLLPAFGKRDHRVISFKVKNQYKKPVQKITC